MPLALILIGWASWTNPTHQSPTYLHSKVTHPKAQKPIKKKEKKKKNSCVKLTPLYLYIIQKTQRSNGPNHFWAHHETLEQAPWHTWVSFFHYINYPLLPLRLRDRSLNSQIQTTEFRETELNEANPPKKTTCRTVRSTTSSPRPMPEPPKLTLSKLVLFARMATSSSRTVLARFNLFCSVSMIKSIFDSGYFLFFWLRSVLFDGSDFGFF